MPSIDFWRPRLHGARFNEGEIPLQVLSDLAALREMVIDVAKWRYLSENPNRQRTPRGFTDKIDLKLAGIGNNSAEPIIKLTTTESILPGMELPHQEFLTRAKYDIAALVASASENQRYQNNGLLPNRFLAHFNRIGRSLRDNESLELPMSNGSHPAMLTKETRQRLLQRSAIIEMTEEVTLRGTVPEADQQRMTFELHLVYGGRVAGPIPGQHREAIIEAFHRYQDNARILVQGIGRYDRLNRLSGMDAIEQVTPLDPLDVPARLDEFRTMQDGWLDGTGKAPSHQGLDWFASDFGRYYPDDAPLPYIYPTPQGGAQAEWTFGPQEVSLNLNLDSKTAVWHQLDVSDFSDDGQEQDLDLDDAEGWDWFIREILRLSEENA